MTKLFLWWKSLSLACKIPAIVVVIFCLIGLGILAAARFLIDPEAVFSKGQREAIDKEIARDRDVQDAEKAKDLELAAEIKKEKAKTHATISEIDTCGGDIDCIDGVLYGRKRK